MSLFPSLLPSAAINKQSKFVLKPWHLIAGLVLVLMIGWYGVYQPIINGIQQDSRQLDRRLRVGKQLTSLQDIAITREPFIPPEGTATAKAMELQNILAELAMVFMLDDARFRFTPKDPIEDGEGLRLHRGEVTLSFTTFIDTNVFLFLDMLQERSSQPIILRSMNMKKKRNPDSADFNLLENGQPSDLIEASITFEVFHIEGE